MYAVFGKAGFFKILHSVYDQSGKRKRKQNGIERCRRVKDKIYCLAHNGKAKKHQKVLEPIFGVVASAVLMEKKIFFYNTPNAPFAQKASFVYHFATL